MKGTEFVHRLHQGDPAAAEWLVAEFERPLLAYFRSHLPEPTLAEDAAQEVFLRLIDAVRGGRIREIHSPRTLLFTIAHNLAIDLGKAWSRRPRHYSLDLSEADGDHHDAGSKRTPTDRRPDPRQEASGAEESEILHAALRRLDAATREVIVLRHLEGVSSREVAAILGVAEGTVWSRLHRGLAELRDLLGGGSSGRADAVEPTEKPTAARPGLPRIPTPPRQGYELKESL